MIKIAFLFFLPASISLADENSRGSLQDTYRKNEKDSLSLFGSVPMEHIVPEQDHIYVAGYYEEIDTVLTSSTFSKQSRPNSAPVNLKIYGAAATPMVAFTHKGFGIGFLGDIGERSVRYKADFTSFNGSYLETYSKARHSGAGLFLYLVPSLKFIPKYAQINLLGGGKNLFVEHRNYGQRNTFDGDWQTEKYRYSVREFSGGINLNLLFSKRFKVIPWLHFRRVLVGETRDSSGNTTHEFTAPNLSADKQMLWLDRPHASAGLDFSLKINRVEVHLGGLFSLITSTYSGSDKIADKNLDLSFSYDVN